MKNGLYWPQVISEMFQARRWARAWKRKASGEGKSGFVRLLIKRDYKQKARIAELEQALEVINKSSAYVDKCLGSVTKEV